MTYWQLTWFSLFRHKARTAFTLLSIVAAFLLYGLLDSVRTAFTSTAQAGADRLITTSNIDFGLPLPQSLEASIRAVAGVTKVEYANSFSGTYRDPANFFPVEGHSDEFLDLYPEWSLSPAARESFLNTRTGVIASEATATQFGWKVGDKIPLQTSFHKKDGSTTWTFDLVGIYRITDASMQSNSGVLYARWDYINEMREAGAGTVNWFALKVPDRSQIDRVARAVDALSANSDHETSTETEYALYTDALKQFADIGLIVGSIMGAVFFTLILLTGNMVAHSVQERLPELATLKAIGFIPASVVTLVIGESVLLLLLGSVLGLGAAAGVVYGVRAKMNATLPLSPVGWDIWLRGLTLAVLVGLTVGTLPALRGMRLRIVDALSGR